jgi:hypothetical protein
MFPYIPLERRRWRLAMGLRPLDVSRWLEVDDRREDELALKAALLRENRDAVVSVRSSGEGPSAELLLLVLENLASYHPRITPEVVQGEHPIVQASLLAQEDFCVLVRDDEWRLAAACVCFPSRWNLASKIGATLDSIHAPVPGYGEELSRPTNSFFERLSPERSYWRLNWTLLDDPTLHQPTGRERRLVSDPEQWFFRVERQTIRMLPQSRAAVFTIRTYVASIEQLKRERAGFVDDLLVALGSAPAETQEYKSWVGVADRLRATLTET